MIDVSRWIGVTLDLNYELQAVNEPPTEPATPVATLQCTSGDAQEEQ